MTSLLLTAFPVPGVPTRRTRDADAAITTGLAGSGLLHDRLLALGYIDTSGNSYDRRIPELAAHDGPAPILSIDLLVPSLDGRFRPSRHGDRTFDAAPGLGLALAAPPILIDVGVTLLDSTVLEFAVGVPSVECAVVIKALAWGTRRQPRDVEDLYQLLEIAAAYSLEEVGGWALDARELAGARGDAAVQLHALASSLRRLTGANVPMARLAALIADRVGFPQ
ncbi:MAG: hypothetical protein R2717_01530 [Schumannella sp.]